MGLVKGGALWLTAMAALMAIKWDKGNELRSSLRSALGIPDEHEPKPWEPGGAWHQSEKTPAEIIADRFPHQSADRFLGPSEFAKPAGWQANTDLKPWPDQSGEAASAAQHSTAAFLFNLETGLRQAEATVQSSVQRMIQMLNFSASPSITPKIAPATGDSPTRFTTPPSAPTPTRTAARGVYADYDNGGDLDWV